jgi:tRNA G18 (ribose-2'-O)-methylase SpoU
MSSAPRHPGLNTIEVGDPADPALGALLAPYRDQKDAWLRAQRDGGTGLDTGPGTGLGAGLADGLFMAEGELVARTLIDDGPSSGHRVVSVLCTPARLEGMAGVLGRLAPGTPVLVAERRVLEGIVGFDLHRGILALGARERPPTAEELIARCRVLVVCEDLANHDNIGAVFRNTACLAGAGAGAGAGVLLSPGCCDPLYRKSLRVSMGHALRVGWARLEPWPAGLARLAGAGFRVLALTPGASATDIRQLKHTPNERLALLLGAEGPGLTGASMGLAAERVRIPMAAGADSLNVATALAVVLSRLGG